MHSAFIANGGSYPQAMVLPTVSQIPNQIYNAGHSTAQPIMQQQNPSLYYNNGSTATSISVPSLPMNHYSSVAYDPSIHATMPYFMPSIHQSISSWNSHQTALPSSYNSYTNQFHPLPRPNYNRNTFYSQHRRRNQRQNKSSFSRKCTVCRTLVICNSQTQWETHTNGKKHIKNWQTVEFSTALNRNREALIKRQKENSSTNANTAIVSIPALKQISSPLTLTTNKVKGFVSATIPDMQPSHVKNTPYIIKNSVQMMSNFPSDSYIVEIDGKRKCYLCDVVFSSAVCEISHIQGKRHRAAVCGKSGFGKRKMSSIESRTENTGMGSCTLCDVEYSSEVMKHSHLIGKKHSKNMRLQSIGQPPKKRKRTNYFSSLIMMNSKPKDKFMFSSVGKEMGNGEIVNTRAVFKDEERVPILLLHEQLQKRVEFVYAEYSAIAKSDPIRAPVLYQTYVELYDKYLLAYKAFAASTQIK